MASVALTLSVLWERDPLLVAALAGPLVAVALYQRSTQRELDAMRLAHTDPLTGLGNYRSFQDRLAESCRAGSKEAAPVALFMVDLDNLKALNDRFGHPAGDSALAEIAGQLRRAGEAFRLGGDEFAVLLPDRDEAEAVAVAERLTARVAEQLCEHGLPASISCGVAIADPRRVDAAGLIEMADSALYWAKAQGKNRVCAYGGGLAALADGARAGLAEDGEGRGRAAALLARALDARDSASSAHARAVGDLAVRLAARLGFDSHETEQVRLAGRLHELGKLVLPSEVLRRAGPLTDDEQQIVRSYPAIAFRMLDSFGLGPVAQWVLHEHERWDGTGYPDGLAGQAIPLASRILFVADAFDAMTRSRPYRPEPFSFEDALAELVRCTGTQFDPQVVSALLAELSSERGLESIRPESLGLPAAAR
jgi:diguanylate cyclase (GGDEF)-like protein